MDAACIGIYGRRGSGKSTLAKSLIKPMKRVIVFDTLGEYVRELGYERCETVSHIRDGMRAGWKRGFRLALVPGGALPERFHNLAAFVWDARAPYDGDRDLDHLTVVVEEANLAIPNRQFPSGKDGALRLALQGRHRGIGLITVSQRPALVNADVRSQAGTVYFFGLTDPLDCGAVDAFAGRGWGRKARELEPHAYLKVDNGLITLGSNALSRKSTRK
jgi:DNA helicase HerA-like ATPase